MAYILVDTREKDNDYVLKDFKRLQYNYEEIKLDEGDYQSSFNPNFPLFRIFLRFSQVNV